MTHLITRTELKAAIDGGAVTVVDALPSGYYRKRHLPGAINLVQDDVAEQAGTLLPDKDALVVTYCSDVNCGNSQAVADELIALGYTQVRTYAAGISDWVGAGLPVETPARV